MQGTPKHTASKQDIDADRRLDQATSARANGQGIDNAAGGDPPGRYRDTDQAITSRAQHTEDAIP